MTRIINGYNIHQTKENKMNEEQLIDKFLKEWNLPDVEEIEPEEENESEENNESNYINTLK